MQPGKRTTIWVKSQIYTDDKAIGIIQPLPLFEDDKDLLFYPTLSTTQNNIHMVPISNFRDYTYTLKRGTHLANFSIITPEQTKHIGRVKPVMVRRLLNENHLNDVSPCMNSLLRTFKSYEVKETHCFQTPQNLDNKRERTPIHTRILKEVREVKKLKH